MSDLALSEQLRALREPPPASGFEERLQQALAREARAPRLERAPTSSVRRIRRWGSRLSLGVALGLGASAAAAAAGSVWVMVRNAEQATPPASPPASPEPRTPATLRALGSKAVLSPPTPESSPNQEIAPTPELAPAPLEAPSSSALRPALHPSEPRAAASRKLADTGERRNAGERATSSALQAPAALTPFELPQHRSSTEGASAGAKGRSTAASEPAARSASERRALPELPAQAAQARGRPEHSKREPSAGPPGRDIARERSERAHAERGLERAREAREPK